MNVLPVKKWILYFEMCASGDSAKQKCVQSAGRHSTWQVTDRPTALCATVATGREYFPQGGDMINTCQCTLRTTACHAEPDTVTNKTNLYARRQPNMSTAALDRSVAPELRTRGRADRPKSCISCIFCIFWHNFVYWTVFNILIFLKTGLPAVLLWVGPFLVQVSGLTKLGPARAGTPGPRPQPRSPSTPTKVSSSTCQDYYLSLCCRPAHQATSETSHANMWPIWMTRASSMTCDRQTWRSDVQHCKQGNLKHLCASKPFDVPILG
jgi:hypothetical protein